MSKHDDLLHECIEELLEKSTAPERTFKTAILPNLATRLMRQAPIYMVQYFNGAVVKFSAPSAARGVILQQQQHKHDP